MVEIEIPKNKVEFGEFVLDVIRTLVALVQAKDPFLRKHSERVANNCANFCEEFKIVGKEDIETVYFAGLLHDIGIVAIPPRSLKENRFAYGPRNGSDKKTSRQWRRNFRQLELSERCFADGTSPS